MMNIQIKKFYYGDIPDSSPSSTNEVKSTKNAWPLWEIFIRSKQFLFLSETGF